MNGSVEFLTGAVLGSDGVSVVTRGADFTVGSSSVMHAALALARDRVAVTEQHVGVRIAIAVARLARATNHHGVAIVTWGTPIAAYKNMTTSFNLPVTLKQALPKLSPSGQITDSNLTEEGCLMQQVKVPPLTLGSSVARHAETLHVVGFLYTADGKTRNKG